MSELMEAVRAGRTAETLKLLTGLTDAERRLHLPELKELRKEMRAVPWWESRSERISPALHLAGAACQTGAAAAADWLAGADMRWRQAPTESVLRALEHRDAGWLADVAHRLARRPVSARVPYPLVSGLVARAGCEVPVTDAYLVGWVQHIGGRWDESKVLDALRVEPHLAALVAGLFTLSDLGEVRWLLEDGPHSWQSALLTLARDGVLDRAFLVDACVARLLRGGGPTDHRVFLPLLTGLALGREEERERVAEWTALARDAVSPVAGHAQAVLASLALDGELTSRQLAEASEGLLFRAEKKLVRAQLVLLGKVLAREPGTAAELLPVVAQAFGHEDAQVQERALKLVERHAARLGSLEELGWAVEQLSPVLRARAATLPGITVASPEVYEEVLPPAPEPVRLRPAPETAVELAEEIGAVLASADEGVAAYERVLDGLVRHAHRDPEALREALGPVVANRWWATSDDTHWPRMDDMFGNGRYGALGAGEGLDLLLAALQGKVSTATLLDAVRRGPNEHECPHAGLSRVFDARLREVAYRLRTDPLPLLLATPTWSTGLLEPADLVARLAEYRRLGARVGAADFAQALLRVRTDDRAAAEEAARHARELCTHEGARLAHLLSAGGPVRPPVRRRVHGPRVLLELGELPELVEGLPQEFHRLGGPVSVFTERWCGHWDHALRRHWLAVLPERRELVAVRVLHDVAATAVDDGRGAGVLPLLAESGGPAGEAVHLCVAYGLGARHAEDRLAAVDALLVLAGRGQLDAAALGADLGQLVRRGAVKPQRLADSARTAAATGAHATVWEILRHTLPVLCADLATGRPEASAVPARGFGDLLAAAADCAERCGAHGELPHLAGIAARKGSSRLVTEARRLRAALASQALAA